MYHNLFGDASFWAFLFSIDQDLAGTARQKACPCGGRLHSAKYPRKPRGSDHLSEHYGRRFSFCCDRDGCRKRVTPPSVRFLGRKVYLAAVVALVTAMRQGPNPRRVRELSERFGADRQTIARWQVFWQEHFPQTQFWKAARGRLVPAVAVEVLPLTPGGKASGSASPHATPMWCGAVVAEPPAHRHGADGAAAARQGMGDKERLVDGQSGRSRVGEQLAEK